MKEIRTTPYHPEIDGLVEWFNGTLKQMLRKCVDVTAKDWDKWLPFILFAYREVTQASTFFSLLSFCMADRLEALWTC